MEVEKFLKDYYGDKQHFKYVADFLCKKENFCHEEIIVVDSSQGFGKTFFSQKLKEYIKENQKNAIVVEYNLSKYDHGDCLIMFFHNSLHFRPPSSVRHKHFIKNNSHPIVFVVSYKRGGILQSTWRRVGNSTLYRIS